MIISDLVLWELCKTVTSVSYCQEQGKKYSFCLVVILKKWTGNKKKSIMDMLTHYSQKVNFLGVIGDLNIRSEFGIDTSTKLLDIFQKLGVKSVTAKLFYL